MFFSGDISLCKTRVDDGDECMCMSSQRRINHGSVGSKGMIRDGCPRDCATVCIYCLTEVIPCFQFQ